MINYFQLDNKKYVRIINDDMGTNKNNTMCFDVVSGDMVRINEDTNNIYRCSDKLNNNINLFDLINKQDIYVNDKYFEDKIQINTDRELK